MDIDFFNIIIKSCFIEYAMVYTFFKILNYTPETKKDKLLAFLIPLVLISIDLILKRFYGTVSVLILNILIQTTILSMVIKKDLFNTFVCVIISNAIDYVILIICSLLEYFICILMQNTNKIFDVLITCIFQLLLIFSFFKIRKFKKGFYFLQKQKSNEYLNIIIVNICSFCILTYSLLGTYNDEVEQKVYFCFVIESIFMIIMIERTLKLSYKHKIIEQTLKSYESQLEQKDKEIQKLSNEKYQISKLNHEFHNRQEALILKVENVLSSMNYEMADENNLKDKIQELSNEYTEKVKENKLESNLPKTGIEEIDDMFTYMKSECRKNNIEFILQVNGNINYLINNIIDKNRLVTLIGDHLRDAIIAVNYSNNKYKSILSILGIKDDNYEFCIYDSGIEFEIETYEKLGIEPASTHKENGGTGIGFITTFETLDDTKASIIIEELNEPKENCYTKCIKFVFDNKNIYKIVSYRANSIKEKIKSSKFEIV